MKPYALALIFTGHMVDLPDRASPRFPPALEPHARVAIAANVEAAVKAHGAGSVVAIASGARGGDILFLEAAQVMGVSIRMMLPFAADAFLDTSVRGVASGDWEARFHALWDGLSGTDRAILKPPAGDDPYDYCNRQTLALGEQLADAVQLLALWDGKDTEIKPGGTASFVAMVKAVGGAFTLIDSEALLQRI